MACLKWNVVVVCMYVCMCVCVCVCVCACVRAYWHFFETQTQTQTQTKNTNNKHAPAEILVRVQVLLAATETQQVVLLNVQRHDLLKQLIQRLVRVRDNQRALVRVIVIQIRDNLHCHVRFARARRSHHHGQARLHARADGLDLRGREGHRVAARQVLRVRADVGVTVGGHDDCGRCRCC